MTKKELMEKLVNPIIDKINEEGLVADIDKIYESNLMKFDKELYHYISSRLAPIILSYAINTEEMTEEEKIIATKLTETLTMACDMYFSKEDGDDEGGTT